MPAALPAYQRRRPEETVLWKTLQEHWRTFVAQLETDDDALLASFQNRAVGGRVPSVEGRYVFSVGTPGVTAAAGG